MKKVDWNNPPKKLRIAINLRTEGRTGFDDSNYPPKTKSLKMKESLLETFASGSEEIEIMLSGNGLFLKYERKKDSSSYIKVRKGSIFWDRIDMIRNITYELVDSKISKSS